MNSNRRVFLFVVYAVSAYLLFSLVSYTFGWHWRPFDRVNLISDVVKGDSTYYNSEAVDTTGSSDQLVIESRPQQDFLLYHTPHYITGFQADTSQASLPNLMAKLYALKHGQQQKVRIAYFGDSMIENDLLTQTFRKRLQQFFGGEGVGFVPVNFVGHKLRQTIVHDYSGGWKDENLRNATDKSTLYLSGHRFTTSGDWVSVTDKTIVDSGYITEKILLCGKTDAPVSIRVNGQPVTVNADKSFNRIVLSSDASRSVRLDVSDSRLPVYGVSFEPISGVIVDNFSFRGVRGDEYKALDSNFLRQIAQDNPYDLIIFQYGVNVLFRANDRNFTWYARMLMPVVEKFRQSFPKADFLITGTADRAFRYPDGYSTAVGIDTLLKIQATTAYETGSHFYNLYSTMGGRNSIVDWANRKPALANKDYVHPNHQGAEVLGNWFFDDLLREFEKYSRRQQKGDTPK